MQMKWMEPSRLASMRRSKAVRRKAVNSAGVISPGRHGELAVLDGTQAPDVTLHRARCTVGP